MAKVYLFSSTNTEVSNFHGSKSIAERSNTFTLKDFEGYWSDCLTTNT